MKGEIDLLRAFGIEQGSQSGQGSFVVSSQVPIDLIVEAPARIEVFAQQLDAAPPSGASAPSSRTKASDPDTEVVALSLAGDLTRELYRDSLTGELFDSASLDHDPSFAVPAEPDFENAAAFLVKQLLARNDPLVIWFTASTVTGEEEPHVWANPYRPFSVRANRLNLAIARLSQKTGVCFVDADRFLAELGAGQHVEGPLRYSPQASARLVEEFFRILEESGRFELSSVAATGPRGG